MDGRLLEVKISLVPKHLYTDGKKCDTPEVQAVAAQHSAKGHSNRMRVRRTRFFPQGRPKPSHSRTCWRNSNAPLFSRASGHNALDSRAHKARIIKCSYLGTTITISRRCTQEGVRGANEHRAKHHRIQAMSPARSWFPSAAIHGRIAKALRARAQ